MKKLNEKIRTYYKLNWLSFDYIPAWNYLKWVETQDARYLIKDIDYERLPDVFDIQRTRLNEAAEFIYNQVAQFSIDTSRRNKIVFDMEKRIAVMKQEYNQVINVLQYLEVKGIDHDFDAMLEAAGFRIDYAKPFWNELERIKGSNENKRIKINEQTAELNAIRGVTTTEQPVTKGEMERAKMILEDYKNREIDLHKISMKYFLTLKQDLSDAIDRKTVKNAR